MPLGDVIEVVTQSWRTWQGKHTTEMQVPFHSGKEAKAANALPSNNATGSQPSDTVANTSRCPSDDTDELHPLCTVEEVFEVEGDNIFDSEMEDPSPPPKVCLMEHLFGVLSDISVDTNGPMADPIQQIPLHPLRNGRSHQGYQVLNVQQANGDQMH
jgi:hypothetical protein